MAATFAIAMSSGLAAPLAAAGAVSWFLVRRVAQTVEELARAAAAIATGEFPVSVTDAVRNRLRADLSHELRTPLATLEAYIDGLKDEVPATRPATWPRIRDQVVRTRRLAVDINLIAASAVATARPQYHLVGDNIAVSRFDGDLPIRCDPGRIQQVLANLPDNALRHIPVRETRTISLRRYSNGSTAAIRVPGRRMALRQRTGG